MFLLDASSSINYPNASGEDEESTRIFEEMVLPFANRLAWRQNLGPRLNESRVGLATFASSATMHIAMDDHFDLFALEQDILATPYMTGATRLSLGLDLVRTQMLDVAHGIRDPEDGIRRVLVVLTDGEATNGFEADGSDGLLRDEGVEIFVVGVTESVNITRLEEMASEPASFHTYYIEQFEELARLVGEVSDDICNSLQSQSSCGDDIADRSYCQAQREEGLCSNAEVYVTCRGSCCGFTRSPTSGPSEQPSYTEPTRAPTKPPTEALGPCDVRRQCYIQQNVSCCDGSTRSHSHLSEEDADMYMRLAQRAIDDLGDAATSDDVTCIADALMRCVDPRCYAGCEPPETQTVQYNERTNCTGNVERASELTVLVNSLLDLDPTVIEDSQSSRQLPALLTSTVSMMECTCSDAADGVQTCVAHEHVSIMTTCVGAAAPFYSARAGGDGDGCGLIGSSGITFRLPAARSIQDSPGTNALVQTILYGHDALFSREDQSTTNRTVSTSLIDITIARARASGRFGRSPAGQNQEVELWFPVMISDQTSDRSNLDTDVRSCEYFLESENRWDATGCRLIADLSNATVTVCRCNHLTTFAVLTDAEDIGASTRTNAADNCGVDELLYIAVCLSILLLALKMVYFLCKNTGRSPTNWIVFWISFMLAVSFCLVLAALAKPSGETGNVVGLVLHFTMLCSVFWTLCLAAHIYVTTVQLDQVSLKNTAMDRRHSFLEDQRQSSSMRLGQRRSSVSSLGSSRAVVPTRDEVRHDRRQRMIRYGAFAFGVPAIVVAITSTWWYGSYNETSAHSAWLSVAAVWGFAAPAACAFITSIIVVIATRHYLYCMKVRLESMGGLVNPTAFAEVDAIIAVMKFVKIQIWMTFTIVILMLVVCIFGTLVLLFCNELWVRVFAAAIAVTSSYILWLAYDVDEVVINPLEWAEMREAGMALSSRSYAIQNRMRFGSQSLRTGSTTDGYISSLGPSDDYLSIGGPGGMNLMDGGSVHMSSMDIPTGHGQPMTKFGRTPSLIEVFRLFDVISARFRDNADLIPQDESITQNLLFELQTQVGPNTDATHLLATMDAQGRHLVGVLTFLATVEAFVDYRLPGEGVWNVNVRQPRHHHHF